MAKIQDILEGVVDVVEAGIDSVASNLQSSASENEAKVKILDQKATQIAAETQLKIERERQIMTIVKIIVFTLVIVVIIAAVSKWVLPSLKK